MRNTFDYPNVLIITEDVLAPSHGTGTTLMRHFQGYDRDKLLNVYYNPVSDDNALPQTIKANFTQASWDKWRASDHTQWHVFELENNIREQIEHMGFQPDVIYSTFFGMAGYMLTQRIREAYDFQLPIIQHFHDLMMPNDNLAPFFEALRENINQYDAVWALTHTIATDIHAQTGRQVQVVNTFCDMPPPIIKRTHRELSAEFQAVITGNIWSAETINDLKRTWSQLQQDYPNLAPIQWYCHPIRMKKNLERHIDTDPNGGIAYGGFLNRLELYETLANADIAIIPFNRYAYPENNYAKYSLPSRLTETVLARVPVFALAGKHTETARYIHQHGIGITSTPTKRTSFHRDLRRFVQDRQTREQMGENAAILSAQYDLAHYQDFFFAQLHDLAQKSKISSQHKPMNKTTADHITQKKVSILICTPDVHSQLNQTCLSSIRQHTNGIAYELLLFENGQWGDFNHAHEMNRALETAQGDVLVCLDDDVEVTAGWLNALLALATPDVGIVGCVHWHNPSHTDYREISHSGGTLNLQDGAAVHDTHVIKSPITAPYACSACILINDMSLRFDTAYKKYYHDVDICLASWERGKKVVISPHPIYHTMNGQMQQMGITKEDIQQVSQADLKTFQKKWIDTGRLNQLSLKTRAHMDIALIDDETEFQQLVDLASRGGERQSVHSSPRIDDGRVNVSQTHHHPTGKTSADLTKLQDTYRESYNSYVQWDTLRTRQDNVSDHHPLLSRVPPLKALYRLAARVYKLGLVWSYLSLHLHHQLRLFSNIISHHESTQKTLDAMQQELDHMRAKVEALQTHPQPNNNTSATDTNNPNGNIVD